MSSSIVIILLLVAILIALLIVGDQASVRYPNYFASTSNLEGMQKRMEQLRIGAFVTLDAASDMAFPGTRDKALQYKKDKRSIQM